MAIDVLIIDDEADIRDLVSDILKDEGFSPRQAADGNSAIEAIRHKKPDLVILDVWLNDSRFDGIQLLDIIHEQQDIIPTLMISGHGTVETAVKALKKGAYDFLEKPFTADRLLTAIAKALEYGQLKRDNRRLKGQQTALSPLLGKSSLIQQVATEAAKIATTNSRVMIFGPHGSGKEDLARYMHDHSPRARASFITFAFPLGGNTEMPPTMIQEMEALLFGIDTKDSLKTSGRVGILEQANNGTLLLKNIDHAPASMQSKLVKVLHESAFTRIGGSIKLPLTARIMATTTQGFETVTHKRLREDLYYRLAVSTLTLPPLSARPDDLPLLLNTTFAAASHHYGLSLKPFSPELMQILCQHPWPMNLIEVRHSIEGIVLHPEYATCTEIGAHFLRESHPESHNESHDPSDESPSPASDVSMITPPTASGASSSANSLENPQLATTGANLSLISEDSEPSATNSNTHRPIFMMDDLCQMPLREAREAFERAYLSTIVQKFKGNISKTASFVEMERSALHRKLKGLNLCRGEDDAELPEPSIAVPA